MEENKSGGFFAGASLIHAHVGTTASRQLSRQHGSKKVMESAEGYGRRHEHDYRTDTDTQTDTLGFYMGMSLRGIHEKYSIFILLHCMYVLGAVDVL